MRYNKKVGDEIFNNRVTPHPQSFFAVFGKNVQDCSYEELLKIVIGELEELTGVSEVLKGKTWKTTTKNLIHFVLHRQ